MEEIKTVDYIDLTPPWANVVTQLIACLVYGNAEAVDFAEKEFIRMAKAADVRGIEANKADKLSPHPAIMLHIARNCR